MLPVLGLGLGLARPSARIVAHAGILVRLLGRGNSLRRNLLALVVAAPWLALASLRVFSLDRAWPLVTLVSFAPLYLVAALIPLAVALLLRARYVAVGVTVMAVVLAVIVLPRALAEDQPDARGQTVTLMTANLLAGSSATDGIERIVRENKVDVLAMQEVDPEAWEILKERGLDDLLPYVIDETRPAVQGNMILSRWPLSDINRGEVDDRFPSPEATVSRVGLRVRSVHPFPPIKPKQTKAWQGDILSMPPARPAPDGTLRVLMGDFNATLDHSAFRELVARDYRDAGRTSGNGLVPTWSANRVLTLAIDHILVDSRIAVLDYKTFNMPRSDHNAVVARVRLPERR